MCTVLSMPVASNDGKSGIKIAYWISKEDLAGYAVDASGNVTSMTLDASTTFKTLNLEKEDAVFTSTMGGVTTSRFWTQTLVFLYKKMGIASRHMVQSASAVNGSVFILRDWNDNFIVMGLDNGAFLTADEGSSGKAFGEVNGETLTFAANEPKKEYYMSSSVFATLTVGN